MNACRKRLRSALLALLVLVTGALHGLGAEQIPLTAEKLEFQSCGWRITAQFQWNAGKPYLDLSAAATESAPAMLTLSLPQAGRFFREAVSLQPGSTTAQKVPLPLSAPNVRNQYPLHVTVSTEDNKQSYSTQMTIRGILSGSVNFGQPLASSQIPESPVGTVVHFAYGSDPKGPFGKWADYRALTDRISACGIKWIRNTVLVEKNEQGEYYVRPYDLDWIRYVHGKRIRIILIIRLYADKSVEEYLKIAQAIVRDTREFAPVYELGNEPYGQGGWRQKYGGTWNGNESDGSTSAWVRQHLQFTNAMADRIKALNPDAKVIGLGMMSPTNFRCLNLGVSNNLDGVVDHPYSFSLPPEKAGFGLRFQKRDGLAIGDDQHSFRGLVLSYQEQFQKTGQNRSLWVTEFGYSSYWYNGSNEKNIFEGMTEDTQAVYILRRFLLSMSLPIAVSCQYDFLDDYNSNSGNFEGNFGLLRSDFTPKPSYYAVQRMNALLNGFSFSADSLVDIQDAPLNRSLRYSVLVHDWDGQDIPSENSVQAIPFINRTNPQERQLAVFSAMPYGARANNRVCSISLPGWSNFGATAIAIDLITGDTFDVPVRVKETTLVIDKLSITEHPIILKLFPKI